VVRSFVAYQVTHQDRPYTRDLLVGTFWLDVPDAIAHRRLGRALWQIEHDARAPAPGD
jgi:DNA-binding SARP family transcriptional activator